MILLNIRMHGGKDNYKYPVKTNRPTITLSNHFVLGQTVSWLMAGGVERQTREES